MAGTSHAPSKAMPRALGRHMNRNSLTAAAIVARCAAGLAIIVLVALFGREEGRSSAEPARPSAYSTSAPAPESAEAKRRQLFELRRQRYAGETARAARADLPRR